MDGRNEPRPKEAASIEFFSKLFSIRVERHAKGRPDLSRAGLQPRLPVFTIPGEGGAKAPRRLKSALQSIAERSFLLQRGPASEIQNEAWEDSEQQRDNRRSVNCERQRRARVR